MSTTKRQRKEMDRYNIQHALMSINNMVVRQREAGKLIQICQHVKIDNDTMFLLEKGLAYIDGFQKQVTKVLRNVDAELKEQDIEAATKRRNKGKG